MKIIQLRSIAPVIVSTAIVTLLIVTSTYASPLKAFHSANGPTAAINAVKSYKPNGGIRTIGSSVAVADATQARMHSKYKDLGWKAQANETDWAVTWTFYSTAGVVRHATWNVHLTPIKVTPTNDRAVEQQHATKH